MPVLIQFLLLCAEEVPKYTPKAKRVSQSTYPSGIPGWHPVAVSKTKVEKPKPQANEKVKIKEKKENVKVTATVDEISEKLQDITVTEVDPTIELSKKLKRLRKRLRESELIDEKIKAGELANPSQLEKSSRRKEFEEEIEQLEAERLKLRQLKADKNP